MTVVELPPDALLQDCPLPEYQDGQSWGYIAEYAAALREAAIACDRCDKERLRAWAAAKRGAAGPFETPSCRPVR